MSGGHDVPFQFRRDDSEGKRTRMKLAILETGTPPGDLAETLRRLSGDVPRLLGDGFETTASTSRRATIRPSVERSRRLSDHRLARRASMRTCPGSPSSPPSSSAPRAGRSWSASASATRSWPRRWAAMSRNRPRAGASACIPIRSSAASPGWTMSPLISVPASHQDQVVLQPPETEVIASSRLHPLCRPRLARRQRHLLPVPPGILARLTPRR